MAPRAGAHASASKYLSRHSRSIAAATFRISLASGCAKTRLLAKTRLFAIHRLRGMTLKGLSD
jgi:hypothetical protein